MARNSLKITSGDASLVRCDVEKPRPAEQEDDYQSYTKFITALRNKFRFLESCKTSTILDTLSDYQATDATTIVDLITKKETELGVDLTKDFTSNAQISAIKERKRLFQQLRFGQEDRREYAVKVRANLERDLFWARNIRDMELFTQSKEADRVFTGIAEHCFLQTQTEFKPKLKKTSEYYENGTRPTFVKLQDLLADMFTAAKAELDTNPGLQSRKLNWSTPQQLRGDSREAFKTFLKEELRKQFKAKATRPIIDTSSDHLEIIFFSIKEIEDDALATMAEAIIKNGGINRTPQKEFMRQFDLDIFTKHIEHYSITGSSMAQIKQSLEDAEIKDPTLSDYKAGLQQVEQLLENNHQPTIAQLHLENSEELLVRQLLELYAIRLRFDKYDINLTKPLTQAFKHLKDGHFSLAVHVGGIEREVTEVYKKLAKVTDEHVHEQDKAIVDRSKVIAESALERQKKSRQLANLFQAQSLSTEELKQLFWDEYKAMTKTLALKEEEVQRLEDHLENMATEMTRLWGRTQQGLPALTEEEEDVYFSILQQIAEDLPNRDFNSLNFKVKHSSGGAINVDIFDASGQKIKSILIDLGATKLPYSLEKPSGGECIFSFGGSRGIIAPFEGLEAIYGSKSRFFTNTRLLGVGQYGSVKEVERLLTGLNQVLKKGYIREDQTTFTEQSRIALRTRPITARDDPLYRIECDVLQNLSQAEQATSRSRSGGTRYWLKADKQRPQSDHLFAQTQPRQYKIIMDRAKGDTFADTANRRLNQFTKADIAYHNPISRAASSQEQDSDLTDYLELSTALLEEAQRFTNLGFTHNDVKPENFLYKRNPDGSYRVKFIDWATGGFHRKYDGNEENLETIFKQIFGDLQGTLDGDKYSDANGRYVEQIEGVVYYGIRPTLQILHGARNGTLPYISPKVLGEQREKIPSTESEAVPELDTLLEKDQTYLDDWALTAMLFGICNRQAYFTLVRGRVATDYVVPGIIELDGRNPPGLKIIDKAKFNQFFSCRDPQSEEEFSEEEEEDTGLKPGRVMFIPSNQREGEPLHLYRRLMNMRDSLHDSITTQADPQKRQLVEKINGILGQVHQAISSGNGLTRPELKQIIATAKECMNQYHNLENSDYNTRLERDKELAEVIILAGKDGLSADDLLQDYKGKKQIELLCTYPSTEDQRTQVAEILTARIGTQAQFKDKFIDENAPCRQLLQECIATGQSTILVSLLGLVKETDEHFIKKVQQEGLLHYAAEQGLPDVFNGLIAALECAGADNLILSKLMMSQYGPTQPTQLLYVKWSTNCLDIAIRNNNIEQLNSILTHITTGDTYREQIKQALHLSALLGNTKFFQLILDQFNQTNGANQITAQEILHIKYPPEELSPYHLFLKDEKTLKAIPFQDLSDNKLTRDFLLAQDAYTLLIAAQQGNYEGVRTLVRFASESGCSKEELNQLFTQRDPQGKNLFNYLLEQGQFIVLSEMLDLISTSCDNPQAVFVNLLSNPHPVSPLINFLNNEDSEETDFIILNQLFDAISPSFVSPELQKFRVTAFLVNQEWLIEKANNPKYHANLRALLHNDKLSCEMKQLLFKTLSETAKEETVAKQFYTKMYKEVEPSEALEEQETFSSLQLSRDILVEVSRQRNDLSDDFWQKLAALQKKMDDLIQQKAEQIESQQQRIAVLEAEVIQLKTQIATKEVVDDTAMKKLRENVIELEAQVDAQAKKIVLLTSTEKPVTVEAGTDVMETTIVDNPSDDTQRDKISQKDQESLFSNLDQFIEFLDPLHKSNYRKQITWCTNDEKDKLKNELDQLASISKLIRRLTDGIEERDKTGLSSAYAKTAAIKASFTKLTPQEKIKLLQFKDENAIDEQLKRTDKNDNTESFIKTIKEKRNLFGFFEATSFTQFKNEIKNLSENNDNIKPSKK